ncbi:MAG: EAL domain-containing protein [Woeseiaceae bacterium]|nr:EAL domain-containing protein [Woeseiaceae bacterium]
MQGAPAGSLLTSGVGRRVLTLFLVAAVVPLMVAVGLAWHEFNRSTEEGAERRLRSDAKVYGVEILTRLQIAADKAVEVARAAEQAGGGQLPATGFLVNDFVAIWRLGERTPPAPAFTKFIKPSLADREYLASGETKLLFTQGVELVMLRQLSDGGILAFHLDAPKIWGPRELRPFNTEFCVFGPTGDALHCTADFGTGVRLPFAQGPDTRGNMFGEWEIGGATQVAAQWQLFLDGSFAALPLDVVAVQPRAVALHSGTIVGRVFLPAIALVLVLVGYLSLGLVARSLVPLRQLKDAATQFADGDLASRVSVRTGDEFEWLAEAFNSMASRLGRQISALEAMSGIDRMILSGTKLGDVAADVVGHLQSMTGCASAAVIARDADAPQVGTMISSHDGEIVHDRVELPGNVDSAWCRPRAFEIDETDELEAPFQGRFMQFGQRYVDMVPVILNDDLKGVLLLGFDSPIETSKRKEARIFDLAGRFAVALSSVEREETLYRQANFDELTGLPNRQLMKDRLEQHIARARADDHRGALLFLDLDRFKEINDVFGHSVGDVVLVQAAKRIVSEVRDRDMVARLGGDEFVVILPAIRNETIARNLAERLLNRLSEAFTVKDVDHYVGASIGIVLMPDDGDGVETLLKNADAAMYRAKDAGRNRFEFFSEQLNAESRRKIGLERDLRRAFHERELEVHYQPQFDIASGEVEGAEALLRWTHPTDGPISPGEFIPLAEESGLIVEIGAWVVEQVCKDLRKILDRGMHPGSMSVNVSACQLRDAGFHNAVLDPIRRFDIHPPYIQLEVTETAVAQNRDTANSLLNSLRQDGIRVAIDDFGTGYSSLSYLQQMPFDVIKVDKSFVDKIGSGATSDNICRTVIRMAQEMGKKSSAEGVETREQLEFLEANGCDVAQGWYFSKALAKEEFFAFVEQQDQHTQRRKALEIL